MNGIFQTTSSIGTSSCKEVIRENGAQVLKSDGFLRLSKDVMSAIIARSDLVVNEANVTSVRWNGPSAS